MADSSRGYLESRFTFDRRREAVWGHLVAYLSQFIPPGSAVLDLGAGYCSFINRVNAATRVAIDRSAQVCEYAATGVTAYQGDAVDMLENWPPEAFDVVFASNFLEHLDWPTLDRIAPLLLRVLRPGGRIILLQPNFRLNPGRYFDDYTHRTVFTDTSLPDWLTAVGFNLNVVEARFMPLTVRSRWAGLAFLVPLYLRLPWRPLAGQMLVVADKPSSAGRTTGTAAR